MTGHRISLTELISRRLYLSVDANRAKLDIAALLPRWRKPAGWFKQVLWGVSISGLAVRLY
jgi:hypothetical protein